MSVVAQVPILGPILDTARLYGEQTLRIWRQPIKGVPELAQNDSVTLSDAAKYLIAAVAVIYLMSIPTFERREKAPIQPIFLFYFLLRYAVVFQLVHVVMSMPGSGTPFVASMRLQAFSMGVLVPPMCVFAAPRLYYAGPEVFFGAAVESDATIAAQSADQLNIPLLAASFIASTLFLLIGTVIQTIWFKRVYGLGWLRTLIGVFGGMFLALRVIALGINPLWSTPRPLFERIEHYS